MAKWRAIHSSISTSWEVNQLSWMGRTLFTWLCVHADDWGIFSGNLGEIKLKVVPGGDCSLEEINEQLALMEEHGLVRRYQPDGYGPLIWIPTFDDHQPANVIGKRTEPKRPLHPKDSRVVEIREDSPKREENPRKSPSEQNRTEQRKNRIEEEQTADKKAAGADQSVLQRNVKERLLKEMGIRKPAFQQLLDNPAITAVGITQVYEEMLQKPTVDDPVAMTITELRANPR